MAEPHNAPFLLAFKIRLKQTLRNVARTIYRYSRPFARPVAFRTRTYLTAGLRDELNRMQQELTHHIYQQHGAQNARALAAGLHQAIQASRQTILEELAFENAQLKTTLQETVARLDRIEQYSLLSARRAAIHCEPGTVLVRTPTGFVLCSDSDHALLASLLENGELEPGTRRLIERFLVPGDVFVDVGANIGLVSLAAARAMQGSGKIFAFEPFPNTRAMMERSLWINGLSQIAHVREAAVSNHIGRTTLFLGHTSGHHSIFALGDAGTASSSQVEVDLITLDSALPPDQPITLIKIDVEGAELEVVEGATSTLQRNQDVALIAEFGPSHLQRTGRAVDEWLGVFESLGYCFRRINAETGALENVTPDELLTAESTNLFFARPTAPAWKKLGIDL
jgi:FkbM family methyltransferase